MKMKDLRRNTRVAQTRHARDQGFGSMLSSSTRKTCLPLVKLRALRSEHGLPAWLETFRRGNLFGVDDDYFVAGRI